MLQKDIYKDLLNTEISGEVCRFLFIVLRQQVHARDLKMFDAVLVGSMVRPEPPSAVSKGFPTPTPIVSSKAENEFISLCPSPAGREGPFHTWSSSLSCTHRFLECPRGDGKDPSNCPQHLLWGSGYQDRFLAMSIGHWTFSGKGCK